MQPVAIAPGAWLDAPAAASWARMVAAGCPAGGITDAGRTYAEQYDIYYTWLRELSLPKRLRTYKGSAAKPGESKHEGGRALDLSGATLTWVRKYGAEYGWIADRVQGERWHVEYVERRDTHRVPTPAVAPAAPHSTPTPVPEEDDMARLIRHPGGKIAIVGPGPRMTVLRDTDEVGALRMTGAVTDVAPGVAWQQLPDGLAWDKLRAVAQRAGLYTA